MLSSMITNSYSCYLEVVNLLYSCDPVFISSELSCGKINTEIFWVIFVRCVVVTGFQGLYHCCPWGNAFHILSEEKLAKCQLA